MKNFIEKLADVKSYLPKVSVYLLIFAVSLAFTAGAAMAMDEAVAHQGIGITAFVLGVSLTFVWIVDGTLKGLIKGFRDFRKEESIIFISAIIYASIASISLLITIIALALH